MVKVTLVIGQQFPLPLCHSVYSGPIFLLYGVQILAIKKAMRPVLLVSSQLYHTNNHDDQLINSS